MSSREIDITSLAQECSFCCDIFNDPVVLPCGHSQCRDCVQQQVTSLLVSRHAPPAGKDEDKCEGKSNSDSGTGRSRADAPLEVTCASCNHKTAVTLADDGKTAAGLTANRDLAENMRAIAAAAASHGDGGASSAAAAAAAKHLCPHHAGEDIRLWCVDCNVLACVLCIAGPHCGHTVKSTSSAAALEREALATYATGAGAAIAKSLGDALTTVTAELARVATHGDSAAAAIRDDFAALTAMLDARRDALLQECTRMHDEKAKLLRQQRDVVHDALAQAQELSHRVEQASRAHDPVVVLRACARVRSEAGRALDGFAKGPAPTPVCSAADVSVKCEPVALAKAIAATGTVVDERAAAAAKAHKKHKHKHKRKAETPVAPPVVLTGPRPPGFTQRVSWYPGGSSRAVSKVSVHAPKGVALQPCTGNLYVSTDDGQIVVLDPSCKRVNSFCAPGQAAGQLWNPGGIAFTRGGSLLVADTGNSRVSLMTADGDSLAIVGRGATLKSPRFVAVNQADDHVFVSDYGSNSVVELSAELQVLRHHTFARPTGLAVHDNVLCVVEHVEGSVKTFDVRTNRWGMLSACLDMPQGLAIDSVGAAVVVDHGGRQLTRTGKGRTSDAIGNPDVEWRQQPCVPLSFGIAISADDTMIVANMVHNELSVFWPART